VVLGIGFLNSLRGIFENKATGLSAVAGGWSEGFATFGLLAFVVAEIAGVAILTRILRRRRLREGEAMGWAPTGFAIVSIVCAVLGFLLVGAGTMLVMMH
jgi:hypothetical protein